MTEQKTSSILLSISLVVIGFATLIFGSYIIFGIVDATNPNYNGLAASNTLTWTGNSSCGEWVNVTTTTGVLLPFYVNISSSQCAALPAGAIEIVLAPTGGYNNTSINTATETSIAMNDNATFALTLTASNTVENVVRITYNTIGLSGNGVITTETAANASWANSSTTGGQNRVEGQASTITYATIVIPLMGLLLMIGGFISVLMAIKGFSLNVGKGANVESKSGEHSYTESKSERSSDSDDGRG